MINVELFKSLWAQIEPLLEQISDIPKAEGDGSEFVGLIIDDEGITYKTSTYYSGCGTDYFDFTVCWEELNEPIEYFQKKYAEQIKDEEERKQRAKNQAAENKVIEEKRLLQKLKQKYEQS